MRTILLVLSLSLSVIARATDDKYIEVMSKHIDALYKAHTNEDILKAVNAFDRVANVEKEKWEPLYYSAFGNVQLANSEKDGFKKDAYLDLAFASIEKAKTIAPNNSEVMAMEGFIHMIRVTVNPAERGQKYSSKAFEAYQKALAINPNNPRALALMAQMEFGMAEFFKSPTTSACSTAAKSIERFETSKPENPLSPMWGKGMTEDLKAKCK